MKVKEWSYYQRKDKNIPNGKEKMGYVYVAKVKIMQGFSLLKIGATRMPKERLDNLKNASICLLSPAHINFFENEEIIHNYFSDYRVPKKPNQKSQVELFNIDLIYFLNHVPKIEFRK